MSRATLAALLTVGLVSVAGAQPKKAPVAPAKDAAPADPAAGAPADPATAPAPVEETPPGDMNGVDENPDAPKTGDTPDPTKIVVVPDKSKKSGYPIEEALRPITLPQNMSEVSIGPHAVLGAGDAFYSGGDALRARYGIVREVQIGLTYVMAGIYHSPPDPSMSDIAFKPGKAVGLDFTVLLQDWIAVKVGVPIYIDPVAVGINVGAPVKFQLGDKVALGGLDDLLTFRVKAFAPSFYSEEQNAYQAFQINSKTGSGTSRGALRFSGFGVYQSDPKLAIIGRMSLNFEDFKTNKGSRGFGGTTYSLRGGIQYSVKKYLDLGISIGWETLADLASFGPAGFLAVRI